MPWEAPTVIRWLGAAASSRIGLSARLRPSPRARRPGARICQALIEGSVHPIRKESALSHPPSTFSCARRGSTGANCTAASTPCGRCAARCLLRDLTRDIGRDVRLKPFVVLFLRLPDLGDDEAVRVLVGDMEQEARLLLEQRDEGGRGQVRTALVSWLRGVKSGRPSDDPPWLLSEARIFYIQPHTVLTAWVVLESHLPEGAPFARVGGHQPTDAAGAAVWRRAASPPRSSGSKSPEIGGSSIPHESVRSTRPTEVKSERSGGRFASRRRQSVRMSAV